MTQLEREGGVDLLKIVSTMRQDRGGMVQTEKQYVFLHQVGSDDNFNGHESCVSPIMLLFLSLTHNLSLSLSLSLSPPPPPLSYTQLMLSYAHQLKGSTISRPTSGGINRTTSSASTGSSAGQNLVLQNNYTDVI